jgi:hypothetical protein
MTKKRKPSNTSTKNMTTKIKDLELQIDYLVGYAPGSNHWKQEYYIRKNIIDEALNNAQTPQEVREKIYKLQEAIFKLRTKERQPQPYTRQVNADFDKLQEVMEEKDLLKKYFSGLGKKGAKVSNAKRTPEERARLGKLGALKRWGNRQKAKTT